MAKEASATNTEEFAKRIGTLLGIELELLITTTTERTPSGLSLSTSQYALVAEQGFVITGTLAEINAALVGIEFIGTEAIVLFEDPADHGIPTGRLLG